MSEERRNAPDTWWLAAGPVTGIVGGLALGAVAGWQTTPTEGIGPLVGDPVGSAVAGAGLGLTLGVFAGLVVGAVLALLLGRGRRASTARPLAAVVAAVCFPLVLLVLAGIGRVELGRLGVAPFAIVALVGAVAFAWVAGLARERGRPQ